MFRNSQKSYSDHFLQTEALWLQWDESFREHTLTPLGSKDSCPRIYLLGKKNTPNVSKADIWNTVFSIYKEIFQTFNVIKMMGMQFNPGIIVFSNRR